MNNEIDIPMIEHKGPCRYEPKTRLPKFSFSKTEEPVHIPEDWVKHLVEVQEELYRGPGGTIGAGLLRYIADEYPELAEANPFVFEDML